MPKDRSPSVPVNLNAREKVGGISGAERQVGAANGFLPELFHHCQDVIALPMPSHVHDRESVAAAGALRQGRIVALPDTIVVRQVLRFRNDDKRGFIAPVQCFDTLDEFPGGQLLSSRKVSRHGHDETRSASVGEIGLDAVIQVVPGPLSTETCVHLQLAIFLPDRHLEVFFPGWLAKIALIFVEGSDFLRFQPAVASLFGVADEGGDGGFDLVYLVLSISLNGEKNLDE